MSVDPIKSKSRGEFAFIASIASKATLFDGVITGIGDDASVQSLSEGMQLLTSTDMLLEDVHFRRRWHDPFLLGRKSLAVNISDIAAMGGIPRWALLSLGIPADMENDFLDRLVSGFISCASEHRVSLTGGDTCRSHSGLSISVTIMGEQYPELVVRRSGAAVGDDIWVTGTLGDAALALAILESSAVEPDSLLKPLLDPSPRTLFSLMLADTRAATAMIDVSDGILADFGHIAELSGVGGDIMLSDLPLSELFIKHAGDYTASPQKLALQGGEDYELCFTCTPANRNKIADCIKKSGVQATRIGIVTCSKRVRGVNPDGTTIDCSGGYNHFS